MNLAEIGDNIKVARKSKRMTILDTAIALNMSSATISRIENGVANDVLFATILRLAEHVGLTILCAEREGFTLESALADQKEELIEHFQNCN